MQSLLMKQISELAKAKFKMECMLKKNYDNETGSF